VGIFSLHDSVQTGSRAHSASYLMVPGALSPWVNRPGREDDHSPLTSMYSQGQECMELCLHSPKLLSWRGAKLKHGDNLNFTFYLYLYFCSYRKNGRTNYKFIIWIRRRIDKYLLLCRWSCCKLDL